VTESGTPRTVAARELRRSPLAHRAADLALAGGDSVRVVEEPFLAQVNLRAHPDDPVAARVGAELGCTLPLRPGRVHDGGEVSVLWLGPDEWLVVGPDGSASRLVGGMWRAVAGSHGSVVDVSANRTTVRLSGVAARGVLESACSIDLHPRAFAAGSCAQTLLGRSEVVLWQFDDEPGYRILVRNSFACYLADVLLDAVARS
jgi:sarcosine oxidase subunit gamma